MSNIYVVGSINMDLVQQVQSFPQPGETIHSVHSFYSPGGKGANQAVAAAKSGAETYMLGAVGSDAFADELTTSLMQKGVNIEQVLHKAGTSGVATITVDGSGQNHIILTAGANGELTSEDSQGWYGLFKKGSIVLFQNEIPWRTTQDTMKAVRQAGGYTIFNPAPAMPIPEEALPLIDLLVVNETEAEVISKRAAGTISAAKQAAETILETGVPRVILTLGEQGSLYMDQDGLSFVTPAYSVHAVDTTAAGDTFIGALAARLALTSQFKDWNEALAYASAAAALTVTRRGAQESIPTLQQIEAFIAGQASS
ncbi:ribokinase [Marinicrinis sediminis]|uniref:Ribokinase n=1 Tax=Marinicrinis sediminis TaxID=1652465 RepID=A0ABW5R9W6_9BACL